MLRLVEYSKYADVTEVKMMKGITRRSCPLKRHKESTLPLHHPESSPLLHHGPFRTTRLMFNQIGRSKLKRVTTVIVRMRAAFINSSHREIFFATPLTRCRRYGYGSQCC